MTWGVIPTTSLEGVRLCMGEAIGEATPPSAARAAALSSA